MGLGIAPVFLGMTPVPWTPLGFDFSFIPLQLAVKIFIIIMALGTAFMSPVIMTSLRRFTSKKTRATGFNIYYLLMNIGAIISMALVLDGFRGSLGTIRGNLAILDFGCLMAVFALVCALLIDENNFAEESERVKAPEKLQRPLAIFMDVWRERAFQKLLLFLALTLGVRLVFTHQFLVMPKYYTRVLYNDFELGLANSINPTIIVIGLILVIPIINRFNTVKLVILGMAISAVSLVFLAVPIEWVLTLPFIHNLTQAYLFVIISQILVFAIGELIFSPRFTEYIASVAPPDRVSSYMALSALPTFIAKPINGFVSGILIARYCYDGMRPKIETGNISYADSPEFMWMIYLSLAVMSPIAVIALRKFITVKPSDKNDGNTPPPAEEDPAS